MQLLSQAGLRGIFTPSAGTGGPRTRSQGLRRHVALGEEGGEEEEEEDEDDDNEFVPFGRSFRRRRRNFTGDRYPKIPSVEGQKLMGSGIFGANDRCDHSACGQPFTQSTQNKRRRLARRMFDRELGIGSRGRARVLGSLASQDLIPSSKADLIINLNDRCYSGQFSEDGSFFFACGQDFKVRMYDTSNPYDWRYYKTVNYYGGQWTITDATLSPDNKHLAYSSIRSEVCLATTDPTDSSEPRHLDFSNLGGGETSGGRWGRGRNGHFGIWSLRFSGDGDEIVAGTSDYCVYVYDLEAQRSILRIPGHHDDVNAVCFGDKMSPHILYSGSDDTTLKVWDRRSLSSMRPAGMFLGHTEGLTYIDSKGDGRYVISNAKDQTCKLWDLRKMVSTDVGERINPQVRPSALLSNRGIPLTPNSRITQQTSTTASPLTTPLTTRPTPTTAPSSPSAATASSKPSSAATSRPPRPPTSATSTPARTTAACTSGTSTGRRARTSTCRPRRSTRAPPPTSASPTATTTTAARARGRRSSATPPGILPRRCWRPRAGMAGTTGWGRRRCIRGTRGWRARTRWASMRGGARRRGVWGVRRWGPGLRRN